ncbi:hypothetical protein [Methylibium sp.]
MRFFKELGWCNMVMAAAIVTLACLCAVVLVDSDTPHTLALELAR